MRVLITGVPGWLGSRFLELLEPIHDWDLRCFSWAERLGQTKKIAKKIECVEGDIRDPASLREAVKGVDLVYHLAGIIHPRRIRHLYEINTVGTKNILEASISAGVKRFIYVSSNSVGGLNKAHNRLMTEKDAADPYMHYGQSKYQAECFVNEAYKTGKIETVIFRPCWFYGPTQPKRQTTFFKMIKKGNPIIFGSGNNLRSMSYVDNTCEALLLAAETPVANGQTYWVADERPYSSNEIYGTIARLLEVKHYKPMYLPNISSTLCLWADKVLQELGLYIQEFHVAGEMNKDIACSIDKAKKELGYNPKVDLEEGMRRSIEWCRDNGIQI